MEQKLKISQKDNFAANFGEVLRSSAVFWVRTDRRIKSTISFSNYWKFKNGTNVTVLANVRDLKGKLISRQKILFEDSDVCNFSPPEEFEGSVEIEVFSLKNLRIPYAAIMAVYECPASVSMVHSYARAYSQHEIEEGRTICIGEESCWTLREGAGLTSFCVIHNGSRPIDAQDALLGIRNSAGDEKLVPLRLHALAPYETVVIEPRTHFPDIENWLGGMPGNGRLSFRLGDGFTRMLCGVRKSDWSQLQVTHSNFNYSLHETDKLRGEDLKAYMYVPPAPDRKFTEEVLVYPDNDPGSYKMRVGDFQRSFQTAEIVSYSLAGSDAHVVEFSRSDAALPSRIVTALRINGPEGVIPAECSLGVSHRDFPAKHSAWMLVSDALNSTIAWTDSKEIFGGCPPDAELSFTLYSAKQKNAVTGVKRYEDMPRNGVITLRDFIPEAGILGDEFGYLFLRATYGGFTFYSSIQKENSYSIEHSF